MRNSNIIEKAHQVGDTNAKGEVWVEYKPGKFDWRPPKHKAVVAYHQSKGQGVGDGGNQHQPSQQPQVKQPTGNKPQPQSQTQQPKQANGFEDMNPDEIADFANSAKTSALAAVVNNKKIDQGVRLIAFNVLKKRDDYDKTAVDSSDLPGGHVAKPKPKIDYKTKKPEVDIDVPDTWTILVPGKNGAKERKIVNASLQRKLYAKKSDTDLLKQLNNPKATWQNRQIAYDEAAARGIKEDDIDISGTLQNKWDKEKRKHDYAESMSAGFNEDEATAVEVDLHGLDADKFMSEFPDGDLGWLNPKDPRVQKQFDEFKTKTARQQYDALKTMYEPTTPGYLDVNDKIGQMNEEYDNFMRYNTAPLLVSAGGAGAGKTYCWGEIAKENGLKELGEGDDPSDNDWGYVMCSDPDDEKDFRRVLAKYNSTYVNDDGEECPHILVFDDADKILTSKAGPMKALMKKITDNDPKKRIFVNPDTGETEVFKGAMVVMTNKDVDALRAANEDNRAIFSRSIISDIHFTRAETMDLINQRWKTMGLGSYEKAFKRQFPTKDEQIKVRKIVRDFLENNIEDADPGKFTPRSFIQVMTKVGPILAKSGKTKTVSGTVQIGAKVPWQAQALSIIKGEDDEFTEEGRVKIKDELLAKKKKMKKENKKKYDVIFGNKGIDYFLGGNSDDDEKDETKTTKKAQDIDLGMSLSEAEDLLLG